MVRLHVNRHALVVALVLFGSILVSFRAAGDPSVNDNGNGTKTARWDFWDAANYSFSSVAMSPGNLTLVSTPGGWSRTTDADFAANGTADSTVRIANGIRLAGNEANLLANGDFAVDSDWTWTNGTPGTVVTHQTQGIAEFVHTSADNSTQFDSMDTGSGWSSSTSGIGADSTVSLEPNNKVEGAGSVKDVISLQNGAMWAGITLSGSGWDLSPYNRISLWLDHNFTGQLSAVLHLQSSQAGPPMWDSPAVTLTNSWQRVEFDITPFGPYLSTVNRIDFRFTGSPVTDVNVFVDDVWLLYRKTLDGAAKIDQTLSKSGTSNGQIGSVLLRWDARIVGVSNVSIAQLNVTVANGTGSSQKISIAVAVPGGWTTGLMDLSALLRPTGTYTISIEVRVAIDTHLATNVTIDLDNVLLLAPDYQDGGYLSDPLDAASPAVWGQVDWTQQAPAETSVSVETRSGSTPIPDPTWSSWKPHNAPGAIGCPDDRYLQFRVVLHTSNSSRTPALIDITLDFTKFATAGWVESLPFTPPEPLLAWRQFNATDDERPGTSITYEVTADGTNWVPVGPGSDLSGLSGTSLQIQASLATTNTSRSPRIVSMEVSYEYFGPLWGAVITPDTWAGTADAASVPFSVQGKDRWSHDIAFTPTWETTDPNGFVSSAGSYSPHTAGTWVVRVRAPSGVVLANASVTVSPGVLARLDLTPSTAAAPAGSQVAFLVRGFDADDNAIVLSLTEWQASAGSFISKDTGSAVLRLPGVTGTVTVTVRHGAISSASFVTVTSDGTPIITGTIPDQTRVEDATWSLDLTTFVTNQPDPADTLAALKWFLTGRDASLYTVWGENYTGNHILVFSGQPDAYGTDDVRLWLEDAAGARASQALQVRITPVNDPPHFDTIPVIPVKAGAAYSFDAEPYIVDVDTSSAGLALSADDPSHVSIAGLNLTLTYPQEDIGRRVYLRLTVSDGGASAQTVVIIDVTSNTPPHVQTPLPDLTLQEDEFLEGAFPQSLSSYFADDDGDDLFFSYGQRDISVVIWNNNNFWQVDVRPNTDWFGVEKVTFRAQDSRGAFAEYSIVVTVNSMNDIPVFSWTSDIYVRFDTPYALDLETFIQDVDTSLEAITLEASPTIFIEVRGFTATFLYPRFLLGQGASYDLNATLYVNDTGPGAFRRVFVHVSDNTPPILQRLPPAVRFNEDSTVAAWRLSDYFFDPDGSAGQLVYNVSGVNVKADIGGDTMVTFRTAAENWFGQEVVHIRAEDGGNAFVTAPVLVRVNPVDDAPSFTAPLDDRDLTGGGVLVLDLRDYVVDVDDAVENLTFTARGPHASVYGYILVLDVPAAGDSGEVLVTASDGRLDASDSFYLTTHRPTIWAQIYWPWSGVGTLLAAIVLLLAWELFLRFPRTLEDVFVIGKEGRLMMHKTRRLQADRDEDILAGMLTAIMLFVRDSFREEQDDLKQFEFGERRVLVERGRHCYIAAIFAGLAPPWARKDLVAFLADIEAGLGDHLEGWSGDRDDIAALKGMTEEFVRRRRYRNGWWPFPRPASWASPVSSGIVGPRTSDSRDSVRSSMGGRKGR